LGSPATSSILLCEQFFYMSKDGGLTRKLYNSSLIPVLSHDVSNIFSNNKINIIRQLVVILWFCCRLFSLVITRCIFVQRPIDHTCNAPNSHDWAS
jgi:hypothetical protein